VVGAAGVPVAREGPSRSVQANCPEFYYGAGAEAHNQFNGNSGPEALVNLGNASTRIRVAQ
jgi:hypothetical protein